MKISVHIPKTAGTTFAEVLKARHGNRLAFFYGPDDPRTHPALQADPPFEAQAIQRLADDGIEILHGHFAAQHFADAVPDPEDYWVWLRDPVERVISNFYFHRNALDAGNATAKAIHDGEMDLAAYSDVELAQNTFRRMIYPFAIEDFGFVGITEVFEDSLALLGMTPVRGKRYTNVNHEKPDTNVKTRMHIAERNLGDVAIYSAALALVGRRIAENQSRRPGKSGLLSRLMS